MTTTVVNKNTSAYDIYIGRERNSRFHFGNPFTHKEGTLASVVLKSRAEAVQTYRDWLNGSKWQSIEPERRTWILANLPKLRNKRLGCFCKPLACHGDVLVELCNVVKEEGMKND